MTPEQQNMLEEVFNWMQQKKVQQISFPLDDASRNASGFASRVGQGSTTKTQTYTDSNGDTLTGPKAYLGTVIFLADGTQYEIPYIA